MADLLGTGSAWLHSQRHAHLTRTVTYTPTGGGQPIELDATVGFNRFEMQDPSGVLHSVSSRDYLIRAEDLPGEPAVGDRITDGEGTFEVLEPNGEPHWRWSDEVRTVYRVHTKEVAA